MKKSLTLHPIGIIRSPFKSQEGTPVQPAFSEEAEGSVEIDPEYADGLDDVDGFERIWLLFWLHRARPFRLKVVPYRDVVERGLFSTRAPARPNPIGLSVVKVVARYGNTLRVTGLDILDNTPLLDIKPYVPDFDAHPSAATGWLEEGKLDRRQADSRFARPDEQVEYLLKDGDVVLCLMHGCIETSARRVHRQLADSCLQGVEGPEIASALALLGDFIETAHFVELRNRSSNLACASGRRVRLRRDAQGAVVVT